MVEGDPPSKLPNIRYDDPRAVKYWAESLERLRRELEARFAKEVYGDVEQGEAG